MAKAASRGWRLLRRLSAGAALLFLVTAFGLWLARDLPRRRVERELAGRLGADVRLGALSASGLRDFVLRDIEIRRMLSEPRLDRVRIATLSVRGSLPACLEGRFERLSIGGLEIRVSPPPPGPPPPAAAPVDVHVGRLDIHDGRILVAAGGEESALDLEASLTGVGGDLAGQVRARAARLPLLPLVTLSLGGGAPRIERGALEGFEASVAVADGGRRLTLDASARSAAIRAGGRDVAVPSPSLHAEVRQAGPDAPISIEARPRLPFAGTVEASATLDPKSWGFLEGRAVVEGIDVETIAGFLAPLPTGWSVRGRARADVRARGAGETGYEIAALLERVEANSGAAVLVLEDATLRAGGTARIERGTLSGTLRVEVSVPRASGRAGGLAFPPGALPIRATLDARVETGAPLVVDGALGVDINGAGRVESRGVARIGESGSEADFRWSVAGSRIERLATLAREAGLALPGGIEARGSVAAAGTLSGELASPAIAGTIEVAALEASAQPGAAGLPKAAALSLGRARARVAWRAPGGPVEIVDLEAGGTADLPPLAAFPASLSARGVVATAPLALRLDRAGVEASGLARLEASGEVSLAGDPQGSLRVRLEGIDLARWQSFLRPVIGDPAPGYSVQGSAEADLDLTLSPGGRLAGSGTADIRRSGFASEDGSKVLEGLDTSWELSFDAGRGDPALSLHARAPVGGFQLLWGSLFLDGSSLTSSLEASARATRDDAAGAGSLRWTGEGTWTLPEGPRVEATIEHPAVGPLAGTLDLAVADLGATVDRYLRAPLGDTVPFFQRIEGAGSLRATLRASRSEDSQTLSGRVEATGVRVAGVRGYAEVDGLDLDLPVRLAWGAPGPDGSRPLSGEEARGSLRFSRAAVGGLEIPRTTTGLLVRADSVSLEESLTVPILGGSVGLERLRLEDLLRPSRRVETGVALSSLDLGEASRALGFLPLEGIVDGRLPEVSVSPSQLRVEGGGEISLFGGKIAIANISGTDVLSRYPRLAFSATFRDIDLGRVTRRFDFGEMTGTVEGYVRDCELFRGVPVRFEAEIKTVERDDVPRTINVKAINNIAILGTGGGIGVFDRGLQRFFDRYTYDAVGIRLSLANDVFLLRGLERRGGRELFLKGRLPLPIDVVNAQPGKTVSFRTMLERVRSLDFAAATTKP